MFPDETALVKGFADVLDQQLTTTGDFDGLIIGHEWTLPNAGAGGNAGSLDLLVLEPNGELWAIEAKLSRNHQSDPEYVFGNQLKRYAISMIETDYARLYSSLESYLFGHRVRIRPPAALLGIWSRARSLAEMLGCWMELRGEPNPRERGKELASIVELRLRQGRFTCALLTDGHCADQLRWIHESANGFPLGILELTPDARIKVVHRPQSLEVDRTRSATEASELPTFLRIPGTYRPLPSTLPQILNEWAFELYDSIVRPRTIALIGEGQFAKPRECDHASFRFRIPLRSGAPLVLEVGRGAERHMGERWNPGSTSLRTNINLLWAVSEAFSSDDLDRRAVIRDECWSLCVALIDNAGYHIKGNLGAETFPIERPSEESRDLFYRRFGVCNELILDRKRSNGTIDMANYEGDFLEDRRSLIALFDAIDSVVPGHRPLPLLKKTSQVKRMKDRKARMISAL